ncbi:MAG: hypothetical protein GXO78_05770 [Calditrichaeota bacterium]|nr:hypothetical protein [Calditrichota bacterium]
MKLRMVLVFGCILLGVSVGLAQLNRTLILDRVRSYYKAKQFSSALDEIKRLLVFQPEDIEARYWQTRLLMERPQFPEGTQFDAIRDNLEFLARQMETMPRLRNEIQELLSLYRKDFAELTIRITNAPVVGFYVARLPMRFLPPIKLSPLQQARLDEINAYLESEGKLYFNQIEKRDSVYVCKIRDFPVLPQRRRSVKYSVAMFTNRDTLHFAFNLRKKDPLIVEMKHLDELYYHLPDDYAVLLFKRHLRIRNHRPGPGFLSRKLGIYQAVLVPLHPTAEVQIGEALDWKRKAMYWGGLATALWLLVQMSR